MRFYVRNWTRWAVGSEEVVGTGKTVPPLLRRRVTPVGQQALSAAWNKPEAATARLVLASRHGEFSRTLSLLQAVVAGEELSPADFSLSVHHALIGLLSIALHNRRGHSAVAAGADSFCMGMLEAIACLKENPDEPVILIYFDEALPEPFTHFDVADAKPMASVLVLAATGDGVALDLHSEDVSSASKPSQSQMMDFMRFLESGDEEMCCVGAHQQSIWTRHAVA